MSRAQDMVDAYAAELERATDLDEHERRELVKIYAGRGLVDDRAGRAAAYMALATRRTDKTIRALIEAYEIELADDGDIGAADRDRLLRGYALRLNDERALELARIEDRIKETLADNATRH